MCYLSSVPRVCIFIAKNISLLYINESVLVEGEASTRPLDY